jgi:uridine kinase
MQQNNKKASNNHYLINKINDQNIGNLIKTSENGYKTQILDIAKHITSNKTTKFVLVAGPSSAGKTTTSYILQNALKNENVKATVISLDNFFLERNETPLLENGDKDYESLNSIDWKLFNKCINELITKKSSILPIYNFVTGEKGFNNEVTTLEDNEVVIIEGLHALNPIIENYIPHKYATRVFVFPKSSFHLDNKEHLDVFTLRLMRRLIRDVRSRGISPETTLKFWKNVREAENKYVLPFEDTADFVVDTTHSYEPCVYKSILNIVLVNHSKVLQQLLLQLKPFKQIAPLKVPETSLLKEFVG